MIAKEGDGVAMIEQDRAWEGHELRRRAYTPHICTYTIVTVTFDAVVVQCFCHDDQSLLPRVTIGDQLEETDVRSVTFPPSSCALVTGFT